MTKKEIASDLDGVLRLIGHFGRYQIRILSILVTVSMFCGFNVGDYIFAAANIPTRCRIPECENATGITYYNNWTQFAVPNSPKCLRYEPVKKMTSNDVTSLYCTKEHFNQTSLIGCDEYVFENNNTMIYDFEIYCDDSKRSNIGTLENIAYFLILPAIGYMSDKYGRKKVLICCAISRAVFGIGKSFATSFNMYLVITTLGSLFGSGTFSTCYVMTSEYFAAEKRTIVLMVIMMAFSTGEVICGFIAWTFPYWRSFLRVLHIPQLITILYILLLDNSARWLLSKGKIEDAKSVLHKAAKINNVEIPRESLEYLALPLSNGNKQSNKSHTYLELLKKVFSSPIMRKRIMVIPVWWLSAVMIFYGIAINSVGLAGNIYLNYSLTALMEIPGVITGKISTSKLGRKKTLFIGFIMCSLAFTSFTVIPAEYTNLKLAVYLYGKIFVSVSATTVYAYTTELFPTEVRHTLLAISSTVGRVGSILAPQTPLLMDIWQPFPMVLFSSLALISSLLVTLTPETLGTKIPETIEEAEYLSNFKTTKL